MEAIKDDVSIEDSVELDDPQVIETIEDAPKLSKRELALNAITDQRNQDLSNNEGEPVIDRGNPDGKKEPALEAGPELNLPESPVYLNDDGEYAMKLKVNGQEIERTLASMQATAQKHESADIRLQQSNEVAAQLTAREQRIQEHERLMAEKESAVEAQKNSQLSEQDASGRVEALKGAFDKFLDGDSDAAAIEMNNAFGRQEPTQDYSQLAAMAKEEALAVMREEQRQTAYSTSLDKGKQWLSDNHSEMMKDENIHNMVNNQTEIIMRANPMLTPEEVIKQATESVLAITSTKEAGTSNRETNKSNLPSHPKRQASNRYSPPKEVEIDMSPAAVIARQKAQRGSMARRAT